MYLCRSVNRGSFPCEGSRASVRILLHTFTHIANSHMIFIFISAREILGDTSVLVDNTLDPLLRWDSYENFNTDQDLSATEWGKENRALNTLCILHLYICEIL